MQQRPESDDSLNKEMVEEVLVTDFDHLKDKEMSKKDFLIKYAGLVAEKRFNEEWFAYLEQKKWAVCDKLKGKLVSWPSWKKMKKAA